MMKELLPKTYCWYFPIYNLTYPSNNIELGHGKILSFEHLPVQVRKAFLTHWEHQHAINNEYIISKRQYICSKKCCSILNLEVTASNWVDAIDKSFKKAKISVSILSFLYLTYFPIDEGKFVSGEIVAGRRYVDSGTSGKYWPRNLVVSTYLPELETKISKLTKILTKPKSEIDRRIINALSTFEIQTSITDQNVKFVLLVTCLESLLLGKSDRDYLGSRLSEKCAFLFSKDREAVYTRVKKAYAQRSAFIHGSEKKITEIDIDVLQTTVVSILEKLIDLREDGYDNMEKVDTLIKKLKFGG